jgi:uncharacterized membrane protein YbhN (UPF0104 family)
MRGRAPGEEAGAVTSAAPARVPAAHRRAPWRLVLTAAVVALLGVEVALGAPQFSGALGRLERADVTWVAVAAVAAATSMGFFARTRRRLLAAAGVRVRQRDARAAVYVANALHTTLPGGAAFSTAWTVRWMRARGAGAPAIAWVLTAGGVVSTSALAVLGLTGSLLAGHASGAGGLAPDALAVALLAGGVTVLRRRPAALAAAAVRGAGWADRLLRRPPGRSERVARGLAASVTAIRPSPRDWAVAGLCALANWACDAGVLAAAAAALGVRGLPVPVLLLAYVAGMAASSLSLLPAGIGVVDGAMVLVLTAGGLPAATALPVVLLYRLISLGGVVAAGWATAAVQAVRSAGVAAAGTRARATAGPPARSRAGAAGGRR